MLPGATLSGATFYPSGPATNRMVDCVMMEYCIQSEGEQTRKGIDKDSEPSFFF